jgi:UDP-2-acetamido-2,6-beta-L-arabino-hexul-4-ose reductase
MQIVMTGADGFIGKNLWFRLQEAGYENVVSITRASTPADLSHALATADFVFHLAGINRPSDPAEFSSGNADLTGQICTLLRQFGRQTPLVLSSSTQADQDNPYGRSKLAAETHARQYGTETGAPVHLFRLPNVFGKWARPNYNSVVATFCHNVARGLPIQINDASAPLRLLYIDDVIAAFLRTLERPRERTAENAMGPVYETSVGEVANAIESFAASRRNLTTPRVGTGLMRALYSTYLSYLPPAGFDYQIPVYADARGEFVEMVKTPDCGQFSYFTSLPGVTRGDHYHHTKTEKFLVLQGTARFGFRHIVTGETYEIVAIGGEPRIVETVPGWTHNITNIGDDQLVAMVWANELFDRERPDTVAMKVKA